MKSTRFLLFVLPLAVVLAAMGLVKDGGVAAAATGAAHSLHISNQHCTPGGLVNARLNWVSSGAGQQWVELATRSDFAGANSGGPFAASANMVDFHQLQQGRTYWTRVNTHTAAGIVRSAPLAFTAMHCQAPVGLPITAPTGVTTSPVSHSAILVQWNPGVNNIWYCVNSAESIHDLQHGGRTWRNHGCWTTANALQLHGLRCGTTHYINVFAWNHTSSATSHMATGATMQCPVLITAPHGLFVSQVGPHSAQLFWSPGLHNIWFCLNFAQSHHALAFGGPTWFNIGCWTTHHTFTIHNLNCGTTYHWAVFAWNHQASATSQPISFTTKPCKVDLPKVERQRAPIDEARIRRVGDRYEVRLVIGLPNSCHSAGTHEVVRPAHERVVITVWNDVALHDFCAQIYDQYNRTISIGTNFVSGEDYVVRINDVRCVFRAGADPQWRPGSDPQCR